MAGVKGEKDWLGHYTKGFDHHPKFVFPTPLAPQEESTHNINGIIHTVIEPILTDTQEAVVNATLTNATVNLTEITTSNSSFLSAMESTTSSIITDLFKNNETDIMGNNVTMFNETSTKGTDIINTTTTQKIITYVTDTSTEIITNISTNKYGYDDKDFNETMSHQDGMGGDHHKTTFIIMGTMIGLFLVIALVLAAVYVSYKKKNNSVPLNAHYSTNGSREIPSLATPDNDQYNSKC